MPSVSEKRTDRNNMLVVDFLNKCVNFLKNNKYLMQRVNKILFIENMGAFREVMQLLSQHSERKAPYASTVILHVI